MADNNFFHGSRIQDVIQRLIKIAQVNSGTIALIGTSPDGPVGMTRVLSEVDAAKFGKSVFDGRTIPHALDAIFAQGASQVIVINCFDPDEHLVEIANEAKSVASDLKAYLNYPPVGDFTVKATKNAADITLVEGVDYEYRTGDKFITILARKTYPSGTPIKFTYSRFKDDNVVPANIIGGVDDAGERTGIALLDLAYNKYGVTPKILIAPVYIEEPTVLAALDAQAVKLRARSVVDLPLNTTVSGAIESRGPEGDVDNFYTDNNRRVGIYPYVYKPDPSAPNSNGVAFPYSPYFAGMWANVINTLGIHYSPSNKTIAGITKLTAEISFAIGSQDCDSAHLNAAGINTIVGAYGTGLKAWGNRSLAFPAQSDINTFMAGLLVKDILDESVLMASMQFQDLPLNLALIDSITSAVNGFMNTLYLEGAIVDGECTYNKAESDVNGRLVFDMRFLQTPTAEDIIFKSFVDTSLFNQSN